MEIEIRQGKYPGEWKVTFCTESWSDPAREVLAGMEHQIGFIWSDGFRQFARFDSTPYQLLTILNELICAVQARIDGGVPLITELEPGRATYGDAKVVLGEFLMLALWFIASGIESLSQRKLGIAVRAFGRAVELHALFKAHVAHIESSLDAPPPGPVNPVAFRSDQVIKPEWIAHCRAIAASASEIFQLDDLLKLSGYRPEFMAITRRKLKEWARKEVGITFKSGRPKGA